MAEILTYSASSLEYLSQRIHSVIQSGGLVALPTETYYGLGVDPFNPKAVDRLIAAKGREEGKPILVLIGSLAQLSLFAETVPPAASILIEAFWPGPLTILFPVQPALPRNLTAGTGRVGVRWSSCQPLCQLLQRIGPLTGTSANRSGASPPETAATVHMSLKDEVELIIDNGPTPGGLPSTVVEVEHAPRIVRDGAIDRAALESVLRPRGFFLNL